MRTSLLTSLALGLLFTADAGGQTIYSNDFPSGGDLSGWSTPMLTDPLWQRFVGIDRAPSGERFLGDFGNQPVSFLLSGVAPHDSVVLEFDLYVIRSWDGSREGTNGPDVFLLTDRQAGRLLRTTFSNREEFPQSYPGTFPGIDSPPFTGARAVRSLGYTDGDAIYRIRFAYPHTSSTIELTFEAQLRDRYPVMGNESWGLDNISIAIVKGVAASATLAAGEITGTPGDEILVPLYLRDAISLGSSGTTRVRTTLRFNGSMLMPVPMTPMGRIENGDRLIDLELPIALAGDSSIARLPFRVVVGNDTLTELILESTSAVDGQLLLREKAGVFRVKGLCVDGGTRLFVEQPAVLLRAPSPNPVRERATIAFELAADDDVRLEIVDAAGRLVALPVDRHLSAGAHEITIESLAAGRYTVRLVAGREVEETAMVVVR